MTPKTDKKIPKFSFTSRNMVTIIMIPSLIGIHYGWMLLQENRSLVREDEKMELPIFAMMKGLWYGIVGKPAAPVQKPVLATEK